MAALSFKSKLFLAMMVVVVGVSASTLYLTQTRMQAAQQHYFEQQFRDQIGYFNSLQDNRLKNAAIRCQDFINSVRLRALMQRVLAAVENHDQEDLAASREKLYRTALDELREVVKPSQVSPLSQHPAFFRLLDFRGQGLDPIAGVDAGIDDPKARQSMQGQLAALAQAFTNDAPQYVYLAVMENELHRLPLSVLFIPIVDSGNQERLGAMALGYPIPEFNSSIPAASPVRPAMSRIKSGLWMEHELFANDLPAEVGSSIAALLRQKLEGNPQTPGDFNLTILSEPFRAFYAPLNLASSLPSAYQVSFYSLLEVQKEQRKFFWKIVSFNGLGLLGALGISLLLAHGLSVPMKDLVAGTTAIQHGNFDFRVPVRSHDELGRLTAAFNDMAGGLGLKERLLDQVHDAIIVRDLAGRIHFWNQGAKNLYGWTREEALTAGLETVINQHCPAQLAEAHQSVLSAGEWQGELPQITKSGKNIVVLSRRRLLRQANGAPDSILIVNTDITDKKIMEQQFLRSQRVECIGRLASGIAHDLNNVLSPIMMACDLLRLKYQDTRDVTLLESLQTSAQRGADIVKQVLTFARGVEGQKVSVQMRHLIKEMSQIIAETFPKNLTLKCQIPTDLWLISGDATHLHQVLLNLCVNARDAMPQGGVLTLAAENLKLDSLTSHLTPGSQPGPYVLLRVADTGMGIPPENLDKIFDPFFTTKGPDQGTGLGLSTVSGIVRSHNGFIQVESKVGIGTEFKIFLPAAREVTLDAAEVKAETLPLGQGELILIVEDEVSLRDITRQVLEGHGYLVSCAANGAEAVSLYQLRGREIKVVLTDMAMPVMDGPKTIQALKALNPSIKIIAITGAVTSEGGSHNLADPSQLGIQAFLYKPITPTALLRTLQNVLH